LKVTVLAKYYFDVLGIRKELSMNKYIVLVTHYSENSEIKLSAKIADRSKYSIIAKNSP
jgi:hypothetical protein